MSDEAEAVRARHGEAYAALVERASPGLTGRDGAGWLDRLELDHDNIRSALDWAVERGRADVALRILAAIWRFWQIRGHLHEAVVRAARILAMPAAEGQPAALHARAIGAAGSIAYWRGDLTGMRRLYEDALAEARRSQDPATIAQALYDYSFGGQEVDGRGPETTFRIRRETLAESLAIYRELGDERGIANTSWALGVDAIARRDVTAGLGFVEVALGSYRAIDDPFGMGWTLHAHALLLHASGDDMAAEVSAGEAMRLFVQAGDVSAMVLLLLDFSTTAKGRGLPVRSLVLGAAASTLRTRTGTDLALVGQWVEQDLLAPVRPSDDPGGERAWDRGAAMSLDEAIAYALGGDEPEAGR